MGPSLDSDNLNIVSGFCLACEVTGLSEGSPTVGAMSQPAALPQFPLTEQEAAILDFEQDWRPARGSRDQEVRERFGISTPRYFQLLNQLLDRPEALERNPLLVRRLRRLHEQRQESRSAHRLDD